MLLARRDLGCERGASTTARASALRVLASIGALLVVSCFSGDEREKPPPPGYPGGKCLAPDGWCRGENVWCNTDGGAYCFDPADPCEGFFCGGGDRGACVPDMAEGLPTCQCFPGFNNDTWDLYCCPEQAGLDPLCSQGGDGVPDPGGDGDTGDGDTGGTGTGG